MKITVLIHEDLNLEQSELLTKFVEDVARAGGSITVEGWPLVPPLQSPPTDDWMHEKGKQLFTADAAPEKLEVLGTATVAKETKPPST
jgi:hypothetical protein